MSEDMKIGVNGAAMTDEVRAKVAQEEAAKQQAEQQRKVDEHWLSRGWNGRKRNIYVCQKCFGHVVTEDVHEGVTPFMMGCRATKDCSGMMQSSFYRVWNPTMRADFEWRRPTDAEFAGLDQWSMDHVRKGGLLIFPLTDQAKETEKAFQARMQLRARLRDIRGAE